MQAGEAFQAVERAGALEGLGIELDRRQRGVAAGAGRGVLLQVRRVRRAVGAEEELRAARGGRGHQRAAVFLALEHRQAVVVRAQAAGEDGVAVVEQMVRGDRGGHVRAGLGDILRRVAGGDVLEDDLQLGEGIAQRLHHLLDEASLAVEDIDGRIGHLAVDQQQQALALHHLQRRVGLADVGDARVAVGGGAGRVELERDHAGLAGPADLVGRRVVGQVERHQRLEVDACGHAGANAVAVGHRLRGGGHRRLQIGHDDRAAELARGVRHDRGHRGAVAHMQMPVVGAGQRQRRSGGRGEGGRVHHPGFWPKAAARVPDGSRD